jgi:hypothetical protein
MGMVMITCPTTGETVSTGIEMKASTLAYLTRTEEFIPCPACPCDHAWSAVWLSYGRIVKPKRSAAA